jgi:hypothetical protein
VGYFNGNRAVLAVRFDDLKGVEMFLCILCFESKRKILLGGADLLKALGPECHLKMSSEC